ncbi:MAG: DUF2259 domain-containing protein [Treponema sp.]|nr:DUF2259 domain-containing protein [Treponema sp.]
MKKTFSFIFKLLSASIFLVPSYAGDSAAFEDLGFSQDGRTYVFAQYGKTDKKFQAWAEIYTVDVEKNEFVKNEVYKLEPSKKTSEISGKRAIDELKEKSLWKYSKYNLKPNSASNIIYIRENEQKDAESEIVFQSFDEKDKEGGIFYHVKVCPEINGKDTSVKSKFYISLKKVREDGTELGSWKVGTPALSRRGISSYTIDKIYLSDDLRSLVIVVQKTLEDDTGTSIRYMVETLRF